MEKRLSGKVAIVTGAGRNIGREEAMALSREGAKILVNDLGNADETVELIRAEGGEAYANGASASSWQGGEDIVQAALDHFGRVDILINNAGIVQPQRIEEMTEEDFDAVIGVSLKGYTATIRAAAPHFIKQRSGVIVNTGSTSGLGHLYQANYSAAKEGAAGLTRTIARELGQYGVRCNLIRPASFVTHMTEPLIFKSSEDSRNLGLAVTGLRYIRSNPTRVTPTGVHVAALVVLLCLPATAHVSGQDFFIMGDEVGRFPEPELFRTQFQPGGWTLEALEQPHVLDGLLGDLRNRYVQPV